MQRRDAVKRSKEDSEDPFAVIFCNITTIGWVQCDKCDKWFNDHCVSLGEQSDDYIDKIKFICDSCVQLLISSL